MTSKIEQQTAIYAICCSILLIKKVAANRKIDCLLLDFIEHTPFWFDNFE